MRYLILSDIHANLEALEAVNTAAAGARVDATLVLGDIVGYGADPNAVIDRLVAMPSPTIIRGNHDKVAAGLDSVESFNHLARQAIEWTAAALSAERRAWLAALPAGPVVVDDVVEICHGAPFDEDVYIFDDLDARHALDVMERPLCLFGHTHQPAIFRLARDFAMIAVGRETALDVTLSPDARLLVNCGAVGQPRDGDPRAAFGLLDTQLRVLSLRRVAYDVETAQAKIIRAGLPDLLAQRLAVGR